MIIRAKTRPYTHSPTAFSPIFTSECIQPKE
jgi:hypothetical protein